MGTSAASANRLASFKAVGALTALNNVFTSGNQDIQGSVGITLNGNTYAATAGSVAFTGPVTLTQATAVTSGGAAGEDISFSSTINGPWAWTWKLVRERDGERDCGHEHGIGESAGEFQGGGALTALNSVFTTGIRTSGAARGSRSTGTRTRRRRVGGVYWVR